VDHEDGNTLDNRRVKLRVATASQNGANMHKRALGAPTTSRYKGVNFMSDRVRPKPWRAYGKKNRLMVHLGTFATESEAARAYDEWARQTFGNFACLNFPREGERSALSRA
jgi:hypothetical protein